MSDFNITVNDKTVPVVKGQTVLQASLAAGIEIPVFCWHPQMVPVGACRICLVEIEKFPKLQVACATTATEGMIVRTESAKTIKARQGVLEFILAHHPLDCPTCDKGGECDLQNITFKYGLDHSRLKEPKHRFIVDEKSTFDDLVIGPEIVRNQNRCIHCYRCTRIVEEVAFEDDLGAYQRGNHTEILPPPGSQIRNLYSGNVVEYCPVGALTNDDWRYKVRVWLTKQADVICPHCPDGCNLKLWTFHNKIFRATSHANEQVDMGFICDIGRYGYQFTASAERIKAPMVKKNGELTEATWEEAIEIIAKGTADIKSKLSGAGFFGFVGGTSSNEEIYSFQRFMRRVVGTNNIDHRFHRKRKLTLLDGTVEGAACCDNAEFKDIEAADVIMVFGSDLHSENPITSLRVKRAVRKNGAKVVLLNSRPTPLNQRTAAIEAIYKPGSGAVAITGIIDAMINTSSFTAEGLSISSDEIEKFKKLNGNFQAAQAASTSLVNLGTIKAIAEMLVQAKRVIVITGSDIERSPWRDTIYQSISNLKLVCKSAKHIAMPQESNSRGADILGAVPTTLPGKLPLSKSGEFEKAWQGAIPQDSGKDTIAILESIDEDEIECGFVLNADPVRLFPDGEYVRGVMEKLKLLVVMDTFMTDTARVADVILPLSTFAEGEGTRINWEGRLQLSQRAISPAVGSKPGCEILEVLAQALGVKFNQARPSEVYKEMAAFLPGTAPQNFQRFPEEGSLLRAAPSTRKNSFVEIDYAPFVEENGFRFVLQTVNADHHRGTLSERNYSLNKFCDEPFVSISAKEANSLAVSDGDLVEVESKHGRVAGKVHVMPGMSDGLVLVTENFSKLQPNLLMGRQDKADLVKLTKM